MTRPHVGPEFYGLLVVVALITFGIHEGGHWLAAVLLGHDAYYGLNSAGARGQVEQAHSLIISAAGPAVTILQGLLAFALVRGRYALTAFAFLYLAAFMRLMALGVSFILPNDEARISAAFGWGTFTLPALVAGGLVLLTIVAGRRLRLSWRAWLFSWLTGSAAIAAIIWLDAALKG